jgi:hypothetical protein
VSEDYYGRLRHEVAYIRRSPYGAFVWGIVAGILGLLLVVVVALVVLVSSARADCYPPGVTPSIALNDPRVRACADRELNRIAPNWRRDYYDAERLRALQWGAFVVHDPDANRELSRVMREGR